MVWVCVGVGWVCGVGMCRGGVGMWCVCGGWGIFLTPEPLTGHVASGDFLYGASSHGMFLG